MLTGSVQNHVRVAHYAGLLEASRLLTRRKQDRRVTHRTPSVVFNCGVGRVRVRILQNGIASIKYSGVIGDTCFANLRQNVITATLGAKVLLIDMTAVLSTHVLVPPIPASLYPVKAAPGVVICRVDQLELWRQYSVDIGRHGVKRAVFPDEQRALALSMAQTLAGAKHR